MQIKKYIQNNWFIHYERSNLQFGQVGLTVAQVVIQF
jgi:hypothetical protein